MTQEENDEMEYLQWQLETEYAAQKQQELCMEEVCQN